jgi:hypothetical protein
MDSFPQINKPIDGPGEARQSGNRRFPENARIEFLDWLLLSAKGHRRAQFHWRADELESSWVTP